MFWVDHGKGILENILGRSSVKCTVHRGGDIIEYFHYVYSVHINYIGCSRTEFSIFNLFSLFIKNTAGYFVDVAEKLSFST